MKKALMIYLGLAIFALGVIVSAGSFSIFAIIEYIIKHSELTTIFNRVPTVILTVMLFGYFLVAGFILSNAGLELISDALRLQWNSYHPKNASGTRSF